jgi:uroporphyrinogen decarboxylase
MNPRERVVASLNHEEPDRVPLDFGSWVTSIHKGAYTNLLSFLGLETSNIRLKDWIQQLPYLDGKFLDRFGVDTRYIRPGAPEGKSWRLQRDENETHYYITDGWGVKRAMPKDGGLYYDIVVHECPLRNSTVDDLEEYNWPDPADPGFTRGIVEEAKKLREETDYAIVGDFNFESWYENCWYMRGFEQWYKDFYRNPEFVEALLDITAELHMQFLVKILDAVGEYLDVVMQGDDLAIQDGPVMSPEMYRKFIKPRQAKIFDLIKQKTDAKLFYHCCGSVRTLIPDLIEIGVDIINPVQVSAKGMDTKELKEEFGDKICFWGAVDTQHVLPYGSQKEVKKEVKKRINDLAPGGGYILTSVHNVQSDVPPENIMAMCEALQNCRRY